MRPRNLELDRLRAVAIAMTLYVHVMRVFFPWAMKPSYVHSDNFANIWNNAWTGVDLFFVISGFIICRTFEPKLSAAGQDPVKLAEALKTFFVKRFYRIYPVSWVAVALVLVLSAVLRRPEYFSSFANNAEAAIAIFTYTFNFYLSGGHYTGFSLSHYWSLAIEEQFYLLFPVFLMLVRGRAARLLSLVGCLLVITFVVRPLFGTGEILLDTHTRCDGLIYGVLLSLVSDTPWLRSLLPAGPSRAFKTFVFLAILALGGLPGLGLGNAIVIPVACALSTLLVASASAQRNVITLGRRLDPILEYLGSRSYCLYIFHLPMFSLTKELLLRFADARGLEIGPAWTCAYLVTALALSFVATELAYLLVEQPFLRKGHEQEARSGLARESAAPSADTALPLGSRS